MNLSLTLNIKSKYSVATLVSALKHNLEEHKKEYAEAVVQYEKTVLDNLKTLEKAAKKATSDNLKDVTAAYNSVLYLKKPVDATKMYEQYINILNSSADDKIELSTSDANAIINDSWDWAVEAKSINSFYASNAR